MSGKNCWPELIGKPVEEARAVITKERPDVHIEVLAEGSPCTFDYCATRCRVFVDSKNKVTAAPGLC